MNNTVVICYCARLSTSHRIILSFSFLWRFCFAIAYSWVNHVHVRVRMGLLRVSLRKLEQSVTARMAICTANEIQSACWLHSLLSLETLIHVSSFRVVWILKSTVRSSFVWKYKLELPFPLIYSWRLRFALAPSFCSETIATRVMSKRETGKSSMLVFVDSTLLSVCLPSNVTISVCNRQESGWMLRRLSSTD